ncbi:MAG: FAD-dependent monooxygenase [Candidatus Puniceispirillaceae bacterium]
MSASDPHLSYPASCDIHIAGRGLSAQVMALALSQTGYRLSMQQPRTADDRSKAVRDTRTTTIHQAGMQMLSALGVWQNITPSPSPITHIQIAVGAQKDLASSDWLLHFGSDNDDSPMAYTVSNQGLETALLTALDKAPYVAFLSEEAAQQHEADARLLIACDGAASPLRKKAGLKVKDQQAGQTALVALLRLNRPHHQTALQRFLPAGPIALMPLATQDAALVWTLDDARAQAMTNLSEDALAQAVDQAIGTLAFDSSESPKSLTPTLIDTPKFWPLRPHYAYQLSHWRSDRQLMLLAGDAAHALHPLAGMGYNLALSDAAVLADCLTQQASLGLPAASPSLARQYGAGRRLEITALTAATQILNRALSTELKSGRLNSASKWLQPLFSAGMRGVQLSPLRTAFERLARGGQLAKANLLEGHWPKHS